MEGLVRIHGALYKCTSFETVSNQVFHFDMHEVGAYKTMKAVIAFEHVYALTLVPRKLFCGIQVHFPAKFVVYGHHTDVGSECLPQFIRVGSVLAAPLSICNEWPYDPTSNTSYSYLDQWSST